MIDRDKDAEILALRHQIAILERQLRGEKIRVHPGRSGVARSAPAPPTPRRAPAYPSAGPPADRAALAPRPDRPPARGRLPAQTPRPTAYRPVHPSAGPAPGGREPVLGLPAGAGGTARPRRQGRRLHRLGDPPRRRHRPGPRPSGQHLGRLPPLSSRGTAGVRLHRDGHLTGTRMYILAVIEHASRRVRILGATAHPSAPWVAQAARNLVMDLEDAGCRARYLIRDRDGKFPALFDTILADAGIET